MVWIILAVYLLGLAVTFKVALPRLLAHAYESAHQAMAPYKDLAAAQMDADRPLVVAAALLIAMAWFLTVPARLLWRSLAASVTTLAPQELAEQERAELEYLRELAREYNLSMGDESL